MEASRRVEPWVWGAAVAACAAAAAHHQVLWNGFVNVDDPLYVTASARVQEGLTWANARWAATALDAFNWHPLTWLSHMLDVSLWGLHPAGHHLTSLLLHALNAALVFLLVRRLTGAEGRSLAVALLFAVHPLHAESVAWVAERKDTLFLAFYLGAVLVHAGGPPSRGRAAAAFALGAGAMASKPMAVTLPLVLLLVDVWPPGRLRAPAGPGAALAGVARLVAARWAWFLLAAVTAWLTVRAQHAEGAGALLVESSLAANLANAAVSYVRYLGKAFWPVGLAVLYPWRPDLLGPAPVAASLALLAAVSAAAWRWRRTRPWLAFGWAWFLVTLVPVIGVLRFGRQSIADRYTYLPLLGVYLAAVWGAAELLDRARARPAARAALVAVACCALTVLTVRQERRWRDSITLFEHAARVTRENALAHQNLASAYAARGDVARAREHARLGRLYDAQDMIDHLPDHPMGHFRLGNAYAEAERYGEAAAAFERATALDPRFAQAWNNLGAALGRLGRREEALRALERALALDPGNEEARFNLHALGGGSPGAPP